MNKIVLIGNGFDLAHKLKTSYTNFIEWVWIKISDDLCNNSGLTSSSFNNLIYIQTDDLSIGGFGILVSNKDSWKSIKRLIKNAPKSEFKYFIENFPFTYTNLFFEEISKEYQNQTWADIERIYYKRLLKLQKVEKEILEPNEQTQKLNEEIKKLNEDFDVIKCLLKEYLSSIKQPKAIDGLEDIIKSSILVRDISYTHLNDYKNDIKSILTKKENEYIENDLLKDSELRNEYNELKETSDLSFIDYIVDYYLLHEAEQLYTDSIFHDLMSPDHIYFLTFNYTDTESLYECNYRNKTKAIDIENSTIHIHGELEDANNPMIFGYGDEYDKNYHDLELSEIKGVLENIKSMKYLNTSNYRDVEGIINAGPYQVAIMGHSCSPSDNTLLKTIFEHDNCTSIKPYYYQNAEGKDNYSEIIQAISRCFSDKSKLRSVVVNKKHCIPLPQLENNDAVT